MEAVFIEGDNTASSAYGGWMKKINIKETIYRVIILLIGLVIAHLGVTLFILANLGSDPFNVMIQGLYRTVESVSFLTHGRVHLIISFIIIIVLLFVDKTYVRIGTLVCMFCGGPIIDFFNWILAPLFEGDVSLPVKIVVNVIGCVILAYGMTIVIKSEAGTGPNDLVAIVISDKTHVKFSIMRIIVDVCYAGIGFVLGGKIGIGTVICAFVVGPVAGFFLPVNGKIIGNIMSKLCQKNK